MTTPYEWKIGYADASTANYGNVVEEYLNWVVQPSLTALNARQQELAADENTGSAFALSEHVQLIRRVRMTFALSIQSLFEQQLRSYLIACARGFTIEGVSLKKLEKDRWGDELNRSFFKVRGIELQTFDSYETLTQLQMLGNACRHGEGDSARSLHAKHGHLWPEPTLYPWADPANVPSPPVEEILITFELLSRYVAAIVLFWMDISRHGVESLVERQPGLQWMVLRLLERRIPLLEAITPARVG
ncbi:hypothetical protein HBO38_27085 [Pseudomonas veronii]|uniref:Uncharacterized protein n=1 Tax=Pseudomonas veronii TaxID=76761 RepID=A0A7Y1AA84_PSEVE|nr:hypothetical protein [Pseudomonas veronii]NMY12047.1 hypothetical protein [Pseudomonas veronii]